MTKYQVRLDIIMNAKDETDIENQLHELPSFIEEYEIVEIDSESD